MTWVKIDDSFYDHPKVKAIGLDGAGLLVSMLSWSARHLTDGKVPDHVIRDLCPTQRAYNMLVNRLVSEKCLRRIPRGTSTTYLIHDYLHYQESAAEVKARRAAEREKKRAQRLARKTSSPRGRPQGTTSDPERLSRPPDPTRPRTTETAATELPKPDDHPAPNGQPAAAEQPPEPRPLAGLLALGIPRDEADQLITDVGPQIVAQQLEWLPRRPDIRVPRRAIITACRERWEQPPAEPRRDIPDIHDLDLPDTPPQPGSVERTRALRDQLGADT